MSYSNIFQCLHDQPGVGVRQLPYTIFRAFESKDVEQNPSKIPNVHDFCILWDEDHDTRVIRAAEVLFAAGLLPGVQFLREHKGYLSVILAAKTYWPAHTLYAQAIRDGATIIDDHWDVEVGMYDRSGVSTDPVIHMHQCQFASILGGDDEKTLRLLWNIDYQWDLGTKPLILPIPKNNPPPLSVKFPPTPTAT